MLRTDVTGTRPVALTESTTTITSVTSATQEALNRLSSIALGKQFQAQIMSRLNDGTFLVRFADTTARMALPEGKKPGDSVTLTLLSADPRPTFVLSDDNVTEQAVASLLLNTGGAQEVEEADVVTQATRTNALPEQPPNSAPATLSSTGRLIDNLIHASQLNGTTPVLLGKSPIMPAATADAEQLAAALGKTIERSGLFYESHLSQWANGNRSTEEIMQEPQAQLGHRADPAPGVGTRGGSLLEMLRAIEAAQSGQESSVQAPSLTLNNETAQLLSHQLAALEQRRIAWQGELWPGQRFEWEVSEEPARQDDAGQERSWRSTVKFNMPTLGPITASIQLTGDHLQMQVRTASEAAATALRANGNALASALEAAGSPLDLLTISRNEPA